MKRKYCILIYVIGNNRQQLKCLTENQFFIIKIYIIRKRMD